MASELVGITDLLMEREGEALIPRSGTGELRLGLPEAATPAIAAAIAAKAPGPVLFVASTPARAAAFADEVSFYLEHVPLARLPERERLPYELIPDDPCVEVERARALGLLRGQGRALVVASWAALSEHTAGPELATAGIDLGVGTPPPLPGGPGWLTGALEGAGYDIQRFASRPGTAARRGGIVDIFPAGVEHPFRVEFLGDEVESIRQVDLATQRSVAQLDRLHIMAAATATHEAQERAGRLLSRLRTLPAPSGLAAEAAEDVVEQLAFVAEGGHSPYAAFFEPLLYESTPLDHLAPGALVVFEDADAGRVAIERQGDGDRRAREELERRGALPSGLPDLRAGLADLDARFRARGPAIHLLRFGVEELGARRLPLLATAAFAGKLRVLVQQAAAWTREQRPVVVASQQALRLIELMEEDGIVARLARRVEAPPVPGEIVVVPLAAAGGFSVDGGLVFVTDAEVFGFRKRRRPTRTRYSIRPDLVATLEPGDYLVHADHGIARYAGLMRRSVEGLDREYLELRYGEGDRLYVPADQLESVTRYSGPADRPPSLTRLGSGEWTRIKRRVKQAVAEMAYELLDLYARRELAEGHAFAPDGAWQMEMEAAFPFVETPDQLEAISEVKADMERTRPMDRLICGDVGYGKTEVAVRAAFKAVADGKQVAVLVPTTVLAEQHGATFRERTAGFPVRVEVLSRFRDERQQREIVGHIASGEADIVVGTHRLLQRDVQFHDLGLVVVDEEQRFGVAHKERLRQMRADVDTLTLSATPIPRTLQMSLTGIRDLSTVMTPPDERLSIRTYVLQWDDEILREAIERELGRGGQIYLVHNRVHNIERIVERVRQIAPEADIVVGHGQMPEDQLERVMMEFAAGDHDILVCTTIIESGLDIPNVNTIIINDADKLGLSQLYQLRGRVGRSAHQAYAYLLYDRDRQISETAQKRLEAIFEASELGAGFQIALRDLEIRGAGNVLGNEQSGHIADVGFELYTRLVAEAVAALKQAMGRSGASELPPPVPSIDLPLSAHVPENYVGDVHDRLALYQRVAAIDSSEGVAAMVAELSDRFGKPPESVEHLLYVALVRSLGRSANLESIKTDDQMFHLRIRGGTPDELRDRVTALRLKSVLVGPNQVRIDRVSTANQWQPLLVRVLRAMVGPAG